MSIKIISEAASKSEIAGRLAKLGPDAERRWGKMNAHQMVCHLNDSLLIVTGELKGQDRSNFLNRTLVKFAALRVPMQWPPGVKTVPEIDQAAGAGTPPAECDRDRARLLESIERFAAPRRDFAFAPHPIFGAMTEWEWMRWAYLHNDHHLRQFGV
ncbi:MAG TPA: DUF1569 domain-containing protein [Bryobacteraceae bacterium]